jgi:hypothetical protein
MAASLISAKVAIATTGTAGDPINGPLPAGVPAVIPLAPPVGVALPPFPPRATVCVADLVAPAVSSGAQATNANTNPAHMIIRNALRMFATYPQENSGHA